jgi:hypothetical protein
MQKETAKSASTTNGKKRPHNVVKSALGHCTRPSENKHAQAGSRRAGNNPTPVDPPLIRVLLKEALRRCHRLNDLATELGVTYGYISQLRAGLRRTEHISQEFATACARYLGVPTVLVKLWAGRIRADDFVWPGKPVEAAVQDDFEMMASDPMVLGLLPDELRSASHEVRQFVVNLYFEATTGWPGRTLRSLPAALDLLQRAALNEADYESELAKFREELSCAA